MGRGPLDGLDGLRRGADAADAKVGDVLSSPVSREVVVVGAGTVGASVPITPPGQAPP